MAVHRKFLFLDSESIDEDDDYDDKTLSSSVRSENLKDIWKLLDENENEAIQSFDNEPGLKIQGIKASVKSTGIPTSIKRQASVTSSTRPQRDTPTSVRTTPLARANQDSKFKENRLPSSRSTPVTAQNGVSARLSSQSPKPRIRNYNIKN